MSLLAWPPRSVGVSSGAIRRDFTSVFFISIPPWPAAMWVGFTRHDRARDRLVTILTPVSRRGRDELSRIGDLPCLCEEVRVRRGGREQEDGRSGSPLYERRHRR